MRHFQFTIPVLSLLFGWALLVVAEANPTATVALLPGDLLRGECGSIEGCVLTWKTAYGDALHIPLSEVRALDLGGVWDLEFNDGQRLRTRWTIVDGRIRISSAVFGELSCATDQLRSAVPAVSARGVDAAGTPSSPVSATPAGSPVAASCPASAPATNEAPPSSLQTMLRESSVLLRPGEWSVSTALNYAHNRAIYSPNDARQLATNLSVQRGFTPKLEAEIAWSAYWQRVETTTMDAGSPPSVVLSRSDKLRVSDPELSASTMLAAEGVATPECVLVTGLTVPVHSVGEQGFFRTRLGLEFLKTSDPGALFAGISWGRDWDGWQRSPYQPVDHLRYHLGAAIGLNDELAIGFQVQGEYVSEVKDRSHRLLAPSQEPVVGRFWFNFRVNQHTFVETSVSLPANDDAHATAFGVTCVRRY
ncbi:MAG TPA: hypothetical protein VK178_03170 [Opitutaceae bacterium]|nr:hypothetical protein [Opitutaceae bacterium]